MLCNIINTMQYHAIPCNTMQYNAIPCNTMKHHAIPCKTMQYHAMPCNTMQYHAIPCIINNCWRAYHCPVGSIRPFFDIGPIVVLWPNFRSSFSNQSRTIFHALFADPRCVYQMTRGLQERSPSAESGVGESRRIWLVVVPRRRLSELAGRQSIDL